MTIIREPLKKSPYSLLKVHNLLLLEVAVMTGLLPMNNF